MLAGIHALKEELHTVSAKCQEKVESGKFPQDFTDTIKTIVVVLSSGVAVLRQMIEQVSAIDVEFAETWPAGLLCFSQGNGSCGGLEVECRAELKSKALIVLRRSSQSSALL